MDKHAPVKKKYLKANHDNYVTKQLIKAVMKRSKLRNDFPKDKRMLPKSLQKTTQLACNFFYFSNVEPKLTTDNKRF